MTTSAPRKGRPRGFAAWSPQPATLAVLDDVQAVLEEYRTHLPLTARQVFYRLVGQYGYDKTERAYARLCEYLVRARRAQLIPFGSGERRLLPPPTTAATSWPASRSPLSCGAKPPAWCRSSSGWPTPTACPSTARADSRA